MTTVSHAQMPDRPAVQSLRSKSGWIVALGAVYVIAGLIALSSVVFATKVTVFVVGIMMLISGVAEVINAFQFRSWGKFLVWLLLGVLYIVAGFLTFENPLLAAAILTLLLGISLVVSGVMRIFSGSACARECRGRRWCSRASYRFCSASSSWRIGRSPAFSFSACCWVSTFSWQGSAGSSSGSG